MSIIDDHKENFSKVIEHLKHEITSLRTGRATPALVEDITVEVYGAKQPMKATASITVQDAKTVIIEPWDKNLIQMIETAINNSDIGINPINDGKIIRLNLPELNQERRQDLIKVLHNKLEEAKITIRKVREEVRERIQKMEKDKEIGEDEKYKLQDELDKQVKDYNEQVKQVGDDKEKEINTI